jgi:hypothetical protein
VEITPGERQEKAGGDTEHETGERQGVITQGEGGLVAAQDSEKTDDFGAGEKAGSVVGGELDGGEALSGVEVGRAVGINLMREAVLVERL